MPRSIRFPAALVTRIATAALCVLSSSAGNTWAQAVPAAATARPSSATLTDLEHDFWLCDYLATTERLVDASRCSTIVEALKARKFAGDTDRLLSWWQQNVVAQHRHIAAGLSLNVSKGGYRE